MKKYLILMFCFIVYRYAIACDCKTIEDLKNAQKSSFDQYEFIFVGKVITINPDGSYKFKIIELLKGFINDPFIEGGKVKNYCSIFPGEKNETWLVYTNKYQDGTINIPECGLSRSYNSPYYSGSDYLPPPPSDDSKEIPESEIINLELRKLALIELQNEIDQIKKWK